MGAGISRRWLPESSARSTDQIPSQLGASKVGWAPSGHLALLAAVAAGLPGLARDVVGGPVSADRPPTPTVQPQPAPPSGAHRASLRFGPPNDSCIALVGPPRVTPLPLCFCAALTFLTRTLGVSSFASSASLFVSLRGFCILPSRAMMSASRSACQTGAPPSVLAPLGSTHDTAPPSHPTGQNLRDIIC